MRKAERTDCSGFSLVELAMLLVVVSLAIMTIAPRYIASQKKDFLVEEKRAVRNARNEILGYLVAHRRLPDADHFENSMVHRLDRVAGPIVYHKQGDAPLTLRLPDQGRDLEVAFWVASLGKNRAPDLGNDYLGDTIAMGHLREKRGAPDTFDDIIDYATLDFVNGLLSGHSGSGDDPPLTSLGSTFAEISTAMIALVRKFHDEKGYYPRSWGDYAFTDVGLDPAEWGTAYDGVYYATAGNRTKVTPADGYTFLVTGTDGTAYVLNASLNWSLWYSMIDEKWYHHSIAAGKEIDITTLVIARAGS